MQKTSHAIERELCKGHNNRRYTFSVFYDVRLYSREQWDKLTSWKGYERKGRDHGLTQVPSRHFPRVTQKSNCFSHQATVWTICGSNPGCGHIFIFSKTSGSTLGPTQPHNRWTSVFFPRGSCGWGVNLTPCHHLVLRVKNEWSFTSSTLYAFVMCTGI